MEENKDNKEDVLGKIEQLRLVMSSHRVTRYNLEESICEPILSDRGMMHLERKLIELVKKM